MPFAGQHQSIRHRNPIWSSLFNSWKTIVDKILGDTTIDFKSTSVSGGGTNAVMQGDLTIAGKSAPVQFQLQDLGGGRIKATAQVVQSKHGVKPFKAFMGALKVKDTVDIEIEATIPGA